MFPKVCASGGLALWRKHNMKSLEENDNVNVCVGGYIMSQSKWLRVHNVILTQHSYGSLL